MMLKANISDVYSHEYTKIKINSDHDLFTFRKNDNMNNVVIIIFNQFLMKITIFIIMKSFQKNVHMNNL